MSAIALSTAPRILVVDDNIDAADMLASLLNAYECQATVAYSGTDALEIADTLQPDLIFLDIGMPAMDGCETARRLRTRAWCAQCRIVALTAWDDPDVARRIAECGIDSHLIKPASLHQILRAVQGVQG